MKLTLPVGVPAPAPVVTDAVKVTESPKVDGFKEAPVIVVVVLALFTVCKTDPELAENFEDPLYTAVIVGIPAPREEVEKEVTPPTRAEPPRALVPLLKVTLPEGVPPEELTAAVNVTDWPKVDGFKFEVTAVAVVSLTFTVALPGGLG